MVHFNISKPLTDSRAHEDYAVYDPDCQHAFILVGEHTVFGVHMTQYHCEKHKYQLIMELDLPMEQMVEYQRLRRLYPDDTFIMSNYVGESAGDKKTDKFSIPQLAARNLKRGAKFRCTIHQGFRPPVMPIDESWFPWNLKDTIPVMPAFDVGVKRIVHFRPFAHNEQSPEFANYVIWGAPYVLDGAEERWEAHMHNVQYASLLTGAHEPWLFGRDHDHVMSLAEAPAWLHPDMLRASTVMTVPAIPRCRPCADGQGSETFTHACEPWQPGDRVALMYRGQQPPRYATAGQTFLWGTSVNNSPELAASTENWVLNMSAMPKRYWK